MSTLFCDGLKEVTLLNGVVRLEFHRLEGGGLPGGDRDLQPRTELVLAIPAQGFVQALALLDQVREGLIKDGVIRPPTPDGQGEPQSLPRKSPNFA
jgi:hypothetical protein